MTSSCDTCENGYQLIEDNLCVTESTAIPAVTATVTTGTVLVGTSVLAESMVQGRFIGSTLWTMFNFLQAIELLALLNLDYDP